MKLYNIIVRNSSKKIAEYCYASKKMAQEELLKQKKLGDYTATIIEQEICNTYLYKKAAAIDQKNLWYVYISQFSIQSNENFWEYYIYDIENPIHYIDCKEIKDDYIFKNYSQTDEEDKAGIRYDMCLVNIPVFLKCNNKDLAEYVAKIKFLNLLKENPEIKKKYGTAIFKEK